MYATSRATAQTHFISLLLAYALIVSLLAPFGIKQARASTATDRGLKENAPAINSANHELSLDLSTEVAGKRSVNQLGRFRGGFSEFDKGRGVGPQLLKGIPWAAHETSRPSENSLAMRPANQASIWVRVTLTGSCRW